MTVYMKDRSGRIRLNKLVVPSDTVFRVPESVAVCPICGSTLWAQCDGWNGGWSATDDGLWVADSIDIDCEMEPDITDPDWHEWFDGHYSMPYVDWLPVDQVVRRWINRNFRFWMEAA